MKYLVLIRVFKNFSLKWVSNFHFNLIEINNSVIQGKGLEIIALSGISFEQDTISIFAERCQNISVFIFYFIIILFLFYFIIDSLYH
jgi:hypothetical protein